MDYDDDIAGLNQNSKKNCLKVKSSTTFSSNTHSQAYPDEKNCFAPEEYIQ